MRKLAVCYVRTCIHAYTASLDIHVPCVNKSCSQGYDFYSWQGDTKQIGSFLNQFILKQECLQDEWAYGKLAIVRSSPSKMRIFPGRSPPIVQSPPHSPPHPQGVARPLARP